MEMFSQYRPLFADAINSGRIGLCKWIESGVSIDTALPELGSLTNDKEEWRAIIVRYIDDGSMSSCRTNPQNPFDFDEYREMSDQTEESKIPLVRLTQMLGGVPPLEIRFRADVIKEEHMAPRTVYVPVVDEELEQAHKALVQKYDYDGKMPSSILILSVRSSVPDDDNIGKAWLYHKESEGSEFWKRNHYPSLCRFLVCDFDNQGPVKREKDNFNFWLSLMLLSINEFDSSVLQAYRLYTVNTCVNKESMTESFQVTADKLITAKNYLDRSIKKDIENSICEEEALPDYRMEVSVPIKLPNVKERMVRKKSFPVLSKGASSDLTIWNRQKNAIEEGLASSVRSAERTLDKTANKMRPRCCFQEEEVLPLNRYQEEDIKRETQSVYKNIVELQGKLPNSDISEDKDISESADAVKKYLHGRIMRKPAVLAGLITAVLMILSAVPAFIDSFRQSGKNLDIIGIVLLSGIGAAALTAAAVIVWHRIKLNRLVGKYNKNVKKAFDFLVEEADRYSSYMSEISSHSRASSYLNLSRRKKHNADAEHDAKYKHIRTINVFLGKLRVWCKAYYLDVDFSSGMPDPGFDADIFTSSSENKLYSIETGNSYEIEVNSSGMKVRAPFRFIERIEIIREEIYDDGNN